MGFFDFFRHRKEKTTKGIENADFGKLEKLLPFKVKILGDRGKYIVNIKLEPVGKWVSNILLVDGNDIFFSHEPDNPKVKILAEDLNIPLEYNFTVNSILELVLMLSKVYENLRRLYNQEELAVFYGTVEKIQNLLLELRRKKEPSLCAKIFSELEKIRTDDPDRYSLLRKKLLRECDKIVASFDGGEFQKGCNRRR